MTAVTLAVTALALGTEPSSAGAAPPDALVTYGPPDYAAPLNGRPAGIRSLARLAATVADEHKSDFLGSYVRDDGKVAIVPGNAAGLAIASSRFAQNPNVVIQEATVNSDRAQDLGDQLRSTSPSLETGIYMWGADPESGGIFVTFLTEPTAGDRQAIEDFAATRALPVSVEIDAGPTAGTTVEDRMTDYSAYAGGARYFTASGSGSGSSLASRCSTGFGYGMNGTQYVLTAGHCYPIDGANDWTWIASGPNSDPTKVQLAGGLSRTSWDRGIGAVPTGADADYHGDLAW